jgi:L-lactate dehydrogenase
MDDRGHGGDGHGPSRIAVVGAGHVGSTLAYALVLSGLVSEIVLIEVDRPRAEGEAMDLNHAVPFGRPVRVWAGTYADCAGAAVTVLAAGAAQRPGETRLDLVKRNAAIFGQIVPQVARHNPRGLLLVATNPVDVLTYAAWRLSGLAAARVIGSGTILDTARFRFLLSQHFGVDPRSVHAYVIGEHGDSEVPVWSLANIAGMRLPAYRAAHGVPDDAAAMEDIFRRTRDAAYHIIERKGATYYAVAAGLLRILEAVVRDQRTVLSVSSLVGGGAASGAGDYYGVRDVCLSLPAIVRRGGVERLLRLELEETEAEGLRRSARILRETIDQLQLEGAAGIT